MVFIIKIKTIKCFFIFIFLCCLQPNQNRPVTLFEVSTLWGMHLYRKWLWTINPVWKIHQIMITSPHHLYNQTHPWSVNLLGEDLIVKWLEQWHEARSALGLLECLTRVTSCCSMWLFDLCDKLPSVLNISETIGPLSYL